MQKYVLKIWNYYYSMIGLIWWRHQWISPFKGGCQVIYLKQKIQEKMHETCQIVTKLEGEIINFLILLDSLTEPDEK